MKNIFTQNTPPHVRFSFLLLVITLQTILNPKLFSQTANPQAGDTEIVVQTWGFDSNDQIRFTLRPVGEAYYYGERDCEYVIETMDDAIHNITGQHTGFLYYYTIDHEQSLTSDYEFIYGLLEIKAEWLNHPGISSYFYYDVRDVQYYGNCSQASEYFQDIYLRYDKSSNNPLLWLYTGQKVLWIGIYLHQNQLVGKLLIVVKMTTRHIGKLEV